MTLGLFRKKQPEAPYVPSGRVGWITYEAETHVLGRPTGSLDIFVKVEETETLAGKSRVKVLELSGASGNEHRKIRRELIDRIQGTFVPSNQIEWIS